MRIMECLDTDQIQVPQMSRRAYNIRGIGHTRRKRCGMNARMPEVHSESRSAGLVPKNCIQWPAPLPAFPLPTVRRGKSTVQGEYRS